MSHHLHAFSHVHGTSCVIQVFGGHLFLHPGVCVCGQTYSQASTRYFRCNLCGYDNCTHSENTTLMSCEYA